MSDSISDHEWNGGGSPKEAVRKVVRSSEWLLWPEMTVLPLPSPMNIKLVFFLPTFRLSSSYLTTETAFVQFFFGKIKKREKARMRVISLKKIY